MPGDILTRNHYNASDLMIERLLIEKMPTKFPLKMQNIPQTLEI